MQASHCWLQTTGLNFKTPAARRSPARGQAAAAVGGGGASLCTASTAALESPGPAVLRPCPCRRGLERPRLRWLWCPPAPCLRAELRAPLGSAPRPATTLKDSDRKSGGFGLAKAGCFASGGREPQQVAGCRDIQGSSGKCTQQHPQPNACGRAAEAGELQAHPAVRCSVHSMPRGVLYMRYGQANLLVSEERRSRRAEPRRSGPNRGVWPRQWLLVRAVSSQACRPIFLLHKVGNHRLRCAAQALRCPVRP